MCYKSVQTGDSITLRVLSYEYKPSCSQLSQKQEFTEPFSLCVHRCLLVYCEGHTVKYSLSFSMMAGILSVGISITVLNGFMGTSLNDHLPLKQESASSWTE